MPTVCPSPFRFHDRLRPISCPLGLPTGLILLFAVLLVQVAQGQDAEPVRFNRDIRPILSDRCFLCHGPDQTGPQAELTGLRLDSREAAIEGGVFDFETPADSELVYRITSDDESERMPPPDAHRQPLSDAEVELLTEWIRQGAEYEQHWAYVPPGRPSVPDVKGRPAKMHPIDAFVQNRLRPVGLKPAREADRATLVRRAAFDLTGLPPTAEEVQAFVQDPAPTDEAYERLVDRLLASPRFGEHQARFWLDAARYADTSGYQYDFERTQWVWRDWVIHAFNTNLPFDQFVVEQVAGDLLPDATAQTRLATGFNRNHPITIEGGVVDEEYRTEYVIDRVVTTSTVFLGQTMLCARCHDHKYDPISQADFYRFFAFFNNVPERGLNGFDPREKIASPLAGEQLAIAESELAAAREQLLDGDVVQAEQIAALRSQTSRWQMVVPSEVVSSGDATAETLEDQSVRFSGANPVNDDYTFTFTQLKDPLRVVRLEALTDATTGGKTGRSNNGNFVLSEFRVEYLKAGDANASPEESDAESWTVAAIDDAEADFAQSGFPIDKAIDGKANRDGWAVAGHEKKEARTAVFRLNEPIPAGCTVRIQLQHRYGMQHQMGRVRLSFSPTAGLPVDVAQILERQPEQRSDADRIRLTSWWIDQSGSPEQRRWLKAYQEARARVERLNDFPQTMVMRERDTPREAFVLQRGEYDKPDRDQPVTPGLPSAWGDLGEQPPNRLGLARWLVSSEQPLTARVTVNRFWQQLFGAGLVKTSEDFGSQGAFPSHPDLLDWLAVEFVESGWDVKQILKTIMMSDTYRQSSVVRPDQRELDPDNRWLARGPRYRLDGESIRDAALAVAGLLDTRLGGPSVYPYHPQGLWMEINNRPNFSRVYPHSDQADQLYRRSLYTFWKRAVPPPSMATFDAPSREYCVVRRSRTNTPLQAFVLLHDPQFIEAARHLAGRVLAQDDATLEERLQQLFLIGLAREPNPVERDVLVAELEHQQTRFQEDPAAAQRLLAIGQSDRSSSEDPAELAAWTQLARLILNLSEFVTQH